MKRSVMEILSTALFGKKSEKPKKEDHHKEYRIMVESEMKKYSIGRQFQYMGVPMTITKIEGYCRGIQCHGAGIYVPATYPCITCDYVSSKGEICQKDFSFAEWKNIPNRESSQERTQ